MTASVPPAASVAPTSPPISACEELEGRPRRQVQRFQAIAPIRPQRTAPGVIWAASTIPPAIVAATATEMKAPTKLSTAATAIATWGGAALVEIAVEIRSKVS